MKKLDSMIQDVLITFTGFYQATFKADECVKKIFVRNNTRFPPRSELIPATSAAGRTPFNVRQLFRGASSFPVIVLDSLTMTWADGESWDLSKAAQITTCLPFLCKPITFGQDTATGRTEDFLGNAHGRN